MRVCYTPLYHFFSHFSNKCDMVRACCGFACPIFPCTSKLFKSQMVIRESSESTTFLIFF
jgi:hypothetical protein